MKLEHIQLVFIGIIIFSAFIFIGCENEDDNINNKCPSSVTDYDGNIYDVVKIGDQCWMAENLKVKHYANGKDVPYVNEKSEWKNLDKSDKAWCYYGYSRSNGDIYGLLYSWAAAMNGTGSSNNNPSGVQGVCPEGWHLPSDEEWNELDTALGCNMVGSKLAGNSSLWTSGSLKENPKFGRSGFKALPSGYRNYYGDYTYLENRGYWWTSTDDSLGLSAYSRYITFSKSDLVRFTREKVFGFSVRCVWDE